MPARSFPLTPAPIHVADEVLDDLRRRLAATKWPLDAGNDDGYYGVRRRYLEELVACWADGYDWRAAERAINAYEHYRADVGGVPVHVMRKPGVPSGCGTSGATRPAPDIGQSKLFLRPSRT